MNLDHLTLVVRERTVGELCDLALLMGRRHARDLGILLIIGAAPWLLLDYLCMQLVPDEGWAGVTWWLVLLIFQLPLATAPLTAYLGEAMFTARPQRWSALRTGLRALPVLLLPALARAAVIALPCLVFSAVGDGLPGLLFIFLLLFFPAHLAEVVVLERQGLRLGFRRARQLMTAWRSEAITHGCLTLLWVGGGMLMLIVSGVELVNLLFWESLTYRDFWLWLQPQVSPWVLVLPWPFLGYLSVVRFLAYIDLRTRREGWEIELDLRRAGHRLEPQGDAA